MKNNFIADTENRNESSKNIDSMSVRDMLLVINQNDQTVAEAVKAEIEPIAKTVEFAEKTLCAGGRIFYIGAGTSGRLGVLDASECPPTYGVTNDTFIGIIAGGDNALRTSAEGAEDDPELAVADLVHYQFCPKDLLVGIAASGRTPYVLGGLAYAKKMGAATVLLACSKRLPDGIAADVIIAVNTGEEVITGSTRMKAGTAQKMVLNMISTATMVRRGKVHGNLMVDVQVSNEKLAERARRIVAEVADIEYGLAAEYLQKANNRPKQAIVMAKRGCTFEEATGLLAQCDEFLYKML